MNDDRLIAQFIEHHLQSNRERSGMEKDLQTIIDVVKRSTLESVKAKVEVSNRLLDFSEALNEMIQALPDTDEIQFQQQTEQLREKLEGSQEATHQMGAGWLFRQGANELSEQAAALARQHADSLRTHAQALMYDHKPDEAALVLENALGYERLSSQILLLKPKE